VRQQAVAEVAKKHSVSEGTLYIWPKKFGTMEVADAKRLKGLEAENARLKKHFGDIELRREVRAARLNMGRQLRREKNKAMAA
jgi:putative transposase